MDINAVIASAINRAAHPQSRVAFEEVRLRLVREPANSHVMHATSAMLNAVNELRRIRAQAGGSPLPPLSENLNSILPAERQILIDAVEAATEVAISKAISDFGSSNELAIATTNIKAAFQVFEAALR